MRPTEVVRDALVTGVEDRRAREGIAGGRLIADERRFLSDLQRVRRWRFVDRHFELLDDAGTMLLRFETRPQPAAEAPAVSP